MRRSGVDRRGRRVAFTVVIASALALAACRNKSDDVVEASPAPPPTASGASLPADHVPAGELAEGTEAAYGLKVPFGFRITSRFDKEITLIGEAAPEKADKYVAAHVGGGKKFDYNGNSGYRGVRVTSAPDKPLDIDVTRVTYGTTIRVRDATPLPPPPTGMSQEDILKGAGLDKNGKLLDKTKLE
jgi:hypothetical protein